MKTVKIVSSPVYLDASALIKLYVEEKESRTLQAALSGRTDLMVSDLAFTELTAALARRAREGFLSGGWARRIQDEAVGHLAHGFFHLLTVSQETHRRARSLLLDGIGRTPLRALDALHLALAAEGEAQCLVTYDRRLAEAASFLKSVRVFP